LSIWVYVVRPVRGTKRRKREGVWKIRAYIGRDPVTGKPRQVSRTFHGSAKGADAPSGT
jgi:integrase